MRHRPRLVLIIATLLLLAACGGDDDTAATAGDTGTEAGTATATATEEGETEGGGGDLGAVTLDTASTDLGTILVDGEGMTVYVFDNDSGGESSCYDSCAETWPPVIGDATASGEADDSLIGTTERDDGSSQVTYDDQPLYYYAADTAPGDVNGQGVGDIWWVVAPDGAKVTGSSAAGDLGY